MTTTLNGRVVAVTGGARGIGLATATALAAAGAKVAIGDLDVDLAKEAAARIAGEVIALPLDVTSPQSFSEFLDDNERGVGPLGILVNNAGVMLTGAFLAESAATEGKMIEIDLRGVILGGKPAAGRFMARGGGTLINIASMAGMAGFPGVATYCATKFGVVGLSAALREELPPHGITVCAILPGIVHTELSAGRLRWALRTGLVMPGTAAPVLRPDHPHRTGVSRRRPSHPGRRSRACGCGRLNAQVYSDSKCLMDRSMSPLTARAAVAPIGPNSGLPLRSIRRTNCDPVAAGLIANVSAYLVPPTPSPVSSSRVGGLTLRTVQVTRLHIPLAPATPSNVVPSVSSAGISQRQPWCRDSQSPNSARFDAWAQAWSGGSDSSRDSSSFAIDRS